MTLLSKPVTRESAVFYRGRALVVSIHPRSLTLREKGRRDTVSVDYETLYDFARKRRAMLRRMEEQSAAVYKKSTSRRRERP